jgi:ADP-heptose:LPS heptosyltransferase
LATAAGLGLRILKMAGIILWTKIVRRRQIIFIYRSFGIGDIVCSFESIRILRAQYPNHVIIFGTQEEIVPLVQLHTDVDIVFQVSNVSPIPKLFKRYFDVFIEMKTSIEKNQGPQSKHLMLDMADNFGFSQPITYYHLQPASKDIKHCETILSTFKDRKPLLIAVCNGPTQPVKSWQLDSWNSLTSLLTSSYACTIVQLGHGLNVSLIENTINLTNALTLAECAAFLSLCDGMIGIDGGLLHIARAVGTPALGIFGPTLGPLIADADTVLVQSPATCTGCHHLDPRGHWNTGCPNEVICMSDITAEDVFKKVKVLLDKLRDKLTV